MLEKDIESALIEWLPTKKIKPIGRQVETIIGRCDVVAISSYLSTYVFEVKLGRAPDSAIPQVISYSKMLRDEVESIGIDFSLLRGYSNISSFLPIIVSESLSKMAYRAAYCNAIHWCKYTIEHGGIVFDFDSPVDAGYFDDMYSREVSRVASIIFNVIKPRYALQRFWENFEDAANSGGCAAESKFTGFDLKETVEMWNARIGETGR